VSRYIGGATASPPPLRARSDRASPPPLAGEGREGVGSVHQRAITNVPKKPTWQVKPLTRSRARALRTNSTRAERIVWRLLRAHRLHGVGFRRQTPIGPCIVDFVSHAAKLIIEVDGGQDFGRKQEVRDAARDRFLRTKGFRVLRFSNHDVMTNLEGVWDVIAAAISPSQPSPASGGGEVDSPDLPLNGGGEENASVSTREAAP
jgi:very-short-patch-repair endonuclease